MTRRQAGQQRLALTLTDLFKRQTQPFVLILEDLQWAAESLASLKLLTRSVGNLPLLVIGSYRDDERPALSAELPDAQTLKLSRLDESAVADLSAAMLGQTGRQSQVVELLTRETDGNTFFLVEVVRALAEEAGGLELIAHMSLPQRVLAGGIQAVLSRRLQRVPAWARPALNLAAVAGRQIDLKVMNAALGPLDWDAWLIVCADAAVIEVKEDRWRFAHDKLREAALSAIPEAERMAYHAQVATALETAYPASDALADNLMEHWRAAGDEAKELIYIPIVARQLYNLGLNIPRARQLLEHGLDLATRLPNVDKLRMNLLKQLGDVCDWAGEFLASKNYYERSLALAEQLADDRGRAAALYGIGGSEWQTGDYAQAAQRLEESLQLAHTTGDRFQMAATLNLLGIMRSDQADYAAARSYKQQSLVLLRELGDQRGVTVCLLNLGNDARRLGDYTAALDYLTEGVTLARAINARRSISNGLAYLALVAQRQGNFADALAYISEGLAIDRENDDRYSLINDFVIRANIQLDLQAAEAARHDLHDGLRLAMEAGAKLDILFALIGIADLLMRTDQAEQASKLVGLIDAHPAFTAEMRQNHLQPLLHKLQAILSPGTLAAAMERGRYLDLDTVVQGSLSQLV